MLNACSVFYMDISVQYADIHVGGGVSLQLSAIIKQIRRFILVYTGIDKTHTHGFMYTHGFIHLWDPNFDRLLLI